MIHQIDVPITDCVTVLLSIYFLMRGASRGFMNSLMNPFSVIVTTILSIVYYQITKDVLVSTLIGLFGPLLLTFILKFLLKTWATATHSDVKPGFLSCLGGAILTLAWGWIFIFFTLILLTLMPPWGEKLKAIHHDVAKSASYNYIVKPFEVSVFGSLKQNIPAPTNVTSNNAAQSLAQDPRFQKVLQDPDIQKEIQDHDIVKLMSNPKMMALTQAIMSDPATMKKVMAIYGLQNNPPPTKNP